MADEQELRDTAADIEPEDEEAPQVFAVQRDLDGWRFNRRHFLRAAAVSTAGVVGMVACRGEVETVGESVATATAQPEATQTAKPEPPTATATDAPTATATRAPTSTPLGGAPPEEATATSEATPDQTETPGATKTPTSTATAAPVPAAQYVSDITIPDGTQMQPGQTFTKTWRVRNSGTLDWGEGTQLVFSGGTQMNGTSPTAVANTKPGDTTDISVNMAAPVDPGTYKGSWLLKAANGTSMLTLTVLINVVSPGEVGTGPEDTERSTFTSVTGETRWLPCGSDIPPGYTCTCNCVAGCGCVGDCSCDNVCSCDQVCTCDTVCTCEGHGHYWYPN